MLDVVGNDGGRDLSTPNKTKVSEENSEEIQSKINRKSIEIQSKINRKSHLERHRCRCFETEVAVVDRVAVNRKSTESQQTIEESWPECVKTDGFRI